MLNIKALLEKLVGHFNNIDVFDNDVSGTDALGHTASWYYGTVSNFASGTTLTSLGVNKTIPAGTWIIIFDCRFGASATGYRGIQMAINNSAIGAAYAQKPSVTNNAMALQVMYQYKSTSSFTVDLRARQNSGSAQNLTWYMQLVRLK